MIEAIDTVVDVRGGDFPDVLGCYGRLKVGSRAAISHYGDLLSDTLSVNPAAAEWTVTSPPYSVLPAAANLLAADVATRLAVRLGQSIEQLRLEKSPIGGAFLGTHYAGRSKEDRERYLDIDASGWKRHQGLDGASILFVNDVRITGAQERRLSEFFAQHGVLNTRWQYLAGLQGSSDAPETEEAMNKLGIESDLEFIDLLGMTDWSPTSKSLWRVFGLNEEMFEHAISTVPPEVCRIVSKILIAERVPRLGRVDRWISLNPPEHDLL